eukprot:CAMPEP_0168407072 /NCGR_PEP_ID=MMETSP0228-20121227/25974_1 /TAXON_ID=133427 /ORGANISM="Protoceratium reticulatum, Strain CCCM 535 (=CCMP 1889)" /LENGTH=556 /DNA_ID=CAMNT_0008420731 /DNA_START=15 /DNA_END=1683 /DNA_ORIENTATION=+
MGDDCAPPAAPEKAEANGHCGAAPASKRARLAEAPYSAVPSAVARQLCEYIDTLQDRSRPVVRLAPPEEIRRSFEEAGAPLPLLGEQPATGQEGLEGAVSALLEYSVRTGHPLFFNQLYARGHPTAIAADWACAATNTNCFTYEVAPVFQLVEAEVLSKIASLVGGEYPEKHDGLFVPGGSISNLYGLHIARAAADPEALTRGLAGGPRLVAFTSDQSHYSYLKSARVTGLGSDNLVAVESDGQGRMLAEKLEAAVLKAKEEGKKPFFVGSTAGTTVLGAYDPVAAISDICERHGLWHHVDGCWGGGALLSPDKRHLMEGAERADSIAWNPHKMAGSTLQCSSFLTRHRGLLARANGTKAAYLFQPDKLNADLDIGDKTIQCGRKGDAFKVWLQWKALGDSGMRATIDRSFALAAFLASKIKEDTTGSWQLVFEPSCTNVCFWYVPRKLRPFDWASATKEQTTELHKAAPLIKNEMQRRGDALIGFQAINGRPNFFRMVFASTAIVEESDIEGMLERMARIGEESAADREEAAWERSQWGGVLGFWTFWAAPRQPW